MAEVTPPSMSSALAGYADAFSSSPNERFVTYYKIGKDKQLSPTTLTRLEFWEAARRAASVVKDAGLVRGDTFVLFMTDNRLEDLILRLASVMLGTVPVTVNWQADTPDRIAYKIRATKAKAVFFDGGVGAEQLAALQAEFADVVFAAIDTLSEAPPLPVAEFCCASDLGGEETRIIIFTSGTTGDPKGVKLPYRAYGCSRATFEQFLLLENDKVFTPVVTNPMHHTNSTAMTDWALRRPGTHLHLLQRYSTQYWLALGAAAAGLDLTEAGALDADAMATAVQAAGRRVVAPLVSKHFDFLEALMEKCIAGASALPLPHGALSAALASDSVVILFGSAPVGPTTVARMKKYAGRLPAVRFGSTETCLQVMGTPLTLSEADRLVAFERGWENKVAGVDQPGYYIGRGHDGFTEVRIVKSIEKGNPGYLVPVEEGESGLLVTRGKNLMTGYVNKADATAKVIHGESGGWYVGCGDVCFYLKNQADGGYDVYWQSRESSLLIRGGANYAYDQINEELASFMASQYGLTPESVSVAVIGLRLRSEHDDDACVTIELKDQKAKDKQDEIRETFLQAAKKGVSKGAKPDFMRFGTVARNFKGAVLVKDVVAAWKANDGQDDATDSAANAKPHERSGEGLSTAGMVAAAAAVVLIAILVMRRT